MNKDGWGTFRGTIDQEDAHLGEVQEGPSLLLCLIGADFAWHTSLSLIEYFIIFEKVKICH